MMDNDTGACDHCGQEHDNGSTLDHCADCGQCWECCVCDPKRRP